MKLFRRLLSNTIVNMGKNNRRNRGGNKLGRRDNRDNWKEITKENELWETFYKAQGLIPEEEFPTFKAKCQETLPLTFRVTGSKKHAHEISKLFVDDHIPLLSKLEGAENYKAPASFPWYPNNLGFQIDLPKSVVKKNADYAKTQSFLVTETEVGNISRQEAVSMIPPLVLDVKPHHYVLDMCAAPGSKTAQLIEALHAEEAEPTGFVMANDSDYKRSHMLIHQIKRLNSANFVVVNHDAQLFPKIKLSESGDFIKFDRILCDVPCTGDATMRKNLTVWKDWRIGNAIGLHPLQLNILMRGLQLIKQGGRLVYSTCSMNPMENEAVVAAALRKWGGKVKTVNCDKELPGLIRHHGVSNWKVYGKDMELRQSGAEDIAATLFPPTEEEAEKFHLENCMRVYPQDQNTGGFFITVLEKIDPEQDKEQGDKREAPEEEEIAEEKKQKISEEQKKSNQHVRQSKHKLPRDANEEPFMFLDKDNEELVKCWNFYEIKDTFAKDCTLVRNATGEPLRSVYYVNPIIKNIITTNEQKLKLVYAGIKLFVCQKTEYSQKSCPWRVQNESLHLLKPHLAPTRQFQVNLPLLKVLLSETFPSIAKIEEDKVDVEFSKKIGEMSEGCCFIEVRRGENKEDLFLPLWKGTARYNLLVNKHVTFELLYRLFGIETSKEDYNKIQQQPQRGTPEKTEAQVGAAEVEVESETK